MDFPGGLDPDEFIRQEGLEAFQALKPISAVTYRMRREKERHDVSTEEGRIEYAKACAAILRGVKEPVELENHLRHLSVETGFSKEVLMQQIGAAPPPKVVTAAKREGFRQKAREVSQVDWTARTLLAVLATGRLPKDSVSPEEFEDPLLRSLCEGLLAGESAASLMERQTDDQGRAAVGDILSLNTDLDDDGLMRMAQDCLKKMRKQRLEKALDLIQQRLPTLAGEERERETQRAFALTQQLLDLK